MNNTAIAPVRSSDPEISAPAGDGRCISGHCAMFGPDWNRSLSSARRQYIETFYISLMGSPSVFHLLADIFAKAKAPCVLIGGFAVNFYRISRQTADVDFIIAKEDFEKIALLLDDAGYSVSRYDLFARFTNRAMNLMDIDFLFVDKATLLKILEEGKVVKIAHKEFTVPSLQHLIALKLHSLKNNPASGNKDLLDVVRLITENGINYEVEEFKNLCLKFGTGKIYEKIKILLEQNA